LFLDQGAEQRLWAVVAFFVIRGFVLARSLDRNFAVARFARARNSGCSRRAITTVLIFTAVFYACGFNLIATLPMCREILANMLMLRINIDA